MSEVNNNNNFLSSTPWFKNIKNELTKLVSNTPWLVNDILDWTTKSKVSLELPDELMKSLIQVSEDSWKSVNEIFSQILESWTRSMLVWSKTDSEIKELLWEVSIDSLEWEVLRFIWKNTVPHSKGTEAEVFKMNIPWNDKEVLLVKRKYENTSENEFSLHHIAKDIQNSLHEEWESSVHVPTPIHHFNDWNNEYILMEFVKWKTLHLMIAESVISQETIKLWEKIQNEELRKTFYYSYYSYQNPWKDLIEMDDFYSLSIDKILELLSDENWYMKDIDFVTDEQWNDALINLYWILKEDWIKLDYDPDWLVDMWGWTYVNDLIHNKINTSNLSKIGLFTKEESEKISKDLSKFISYMHSKWLYHVDLWENARNIMFTKTSEWYRIDLIDFWRSEYYPDWKGDNDPYFNEITKIKFTRDENIISRVDWIWIKDSNNRVKLVDEGKDSSLNELISLWEEFLISEREIKYNNNFYWKNLENKNNSFYNALSNILLDRRNIRWYELNLSRSTKNDIQIIRDNENDIIKAEILVLMYFVNESNLDKLGEYIDWLELKVAKKWEYKKLYKSIYDRIISLKKK